MPRYHQPPPSITTSLTTFTSEALGFRAHDQRLLCLGNFLQDIVQTAAARLTEFLALAVPGAGVGPGLGRGQVSGGDCNIFPRRTDM